MPLAVPRVGRGVVAQVVRIGGDRARAFREVYHPARGDHDAPFESSAGLSMLLTDNALTMVTNATTMVVAADSVTERVERGVATRVDRETRAPHGAHPVDAEPRAEQRRQRAEVCL